MDPTKDPTKPGSAVHYVGDRPQTLRDKLVAITPVVMSVVATVLAGLASREMTLAQYYRSLAAQSQSKAGDQWEFFQAKRGRETTLRTTLDVLEVLTPPERPTRERLQDSADRLERDVLRAAAQAERVAAAAEAARESLGEARPDVERAVRQLAAAFDGKVAAAQKARQQILAAVDDPKNRPAFEYLATGTMPDVPLAEVTDPDLRAAVAAIVGGKDDDEITSLSRRVSLEVLAEAIKAAVANAKAYEQASDPLDQLLTGLDQQVTKEFSLVRAMARAVLDLRLAVAGLGDSDTRGVAELRSATAALGRTLESLKATSDSLYGDVKAARHDYTAKRYGNRGDAGRNREVANLYEVQVRRYSVESDTHRNKSHSIFFCMLGAQVGVTIATLALAMRRKSILWSLATVAGVTALTFAAYVFLGM